MMKDDYLRDLKARRVPNTRFTRFETPIQLVDRLEKAVERRLADSGWRLEPNWMDRYINDEDDADLYDDSATVLYETEDGWAPNRDDDEPALPPLRDGEKKLWHIVRWPGKGSQPVTLDEADDFAHVLLRLAEVRGDLADGRMDDAFINIHCATATAMRIDSKIFTGELASAKGRARGKVRGSQRAKQGRRAHAVYLMYLKPPKPGDPVTQSAKNGHRRLLKDCERFEQGIRDNLPPELVALLDDGWKPPKTWNTLRDAQKCESNSV